MNYQNWDGNLVSFDFDSWKLKGIGKLNFMGVVRFFNEISRDQVYAKIVEVVQYI